MQDSLKRAVEYGLQNGKSNMIVELSALKELFDVHDNLESKVQLHENIDIYYCVDGYGARFYTGDGGHTVAEGKGKTLLEALIDLESKVRDFDRKAFFKKLNTRGAETGRFKQDTITVAELAKRLGWDENRVRRHFELEEK